MKPMDILKNMNDLDEKYLAEGELYPEKPLKILTLRRVGAIAAAVALLTVTAFAAAIGVEYWFGHDDDGYYTIDFDYAMEPVRVNQQALDDMARQLVYTWQYYKEHIEMGDYEPIDTRGQTYSDSLISAGLLSPMEDMDSLEDVEAYLGVELSASAEIRAAVNAGYPSENLSNCPITVIVYGLPYEEMIAEYEATGTTTPQGIELQMDITDEGDNNWDSGYRVYIALTEEFAKNYQPEPWYSWEERGQYYVRDYNNGSQDFLIAKVDHTEEYGGICLALHTDGGIGYYLHSETWPTDFARSKLPPDWLLHVLGHNFDGEVSTDPEEILLPLIENLE